MKPVTSNANSNNNDAFVIKLAVVASMSGLLFGYDTVRTTKNRNDLDSFLLSRGTRVVARPY